MMKHITRILLCALLLTSVLLCACGDVSEEYKYELIFDDDALVLKQDDKELDCWPVEDLFAISGTYSFGLFATAQGDEEISALFSAMFSEGVKLHLTTKNMAEPSADESCLKNMLGFSYADIPTAPWGYYEDSADLEAKIYILDYNSSKSSRNATFVFVDRNGNYYMADSENLIGNRLNDYVKDHHLNQQVQHES